jgi:hypothetical protein
MPESRAARSIREAFQSGRPLTYVHSPEEQRVVRILEEVSRGGIDSQPLPLWTWSITEGMCRDGASAEAGAETARGALDFIIACGHPGIFHLKDFHEPLRESAEVRRRLRDVYESCRDRQKFVVITSPVRFLPEEIERSVLFLELRPPDLVELVEFLRDETRRARTARRRRMCSNRSRARCKVSRSTNAVTRCAARSPAGGSWGTIRSRRCSKRSVCW